jgi:hypothetical protein
VTDALRFINLKYREEDLCGGKRSKKNIDEFNEKKICG